MKTITLLVATLVTGVLTAAPDVGTIGGVSQVHDSETLMRIKLPEHDTYPAYSSRASADPTLPQISFTQFRWLYARQHPETKTVQPSMQTRLIKRAISDWARQNKQQDPFDTLDDRVAASHEWLTKHGHKHDPDKQIEQLLNKLGDSLRQDQARHDQQPASDELLNRVKQLEQQLETELEQAKLDNSSSEQSTDQVDTNLAMAGAAGAGVLGMAGTAWWKRRREVILP